MKALLPLLAVAALLVAAGPARAQGFDTLYFGGYFGDNEADDGDIQAVIEHAALLSLNTSEPYHSVAACRAYCRELAEVRDTNNE